MSLRRGVVFLLVLGMAAPASADINSSVSREAKRAAQTANALAAQAGTANGGNPYAIPAYVLMGAGALVTLVGVTRDTGVSCSTNSSFTSTSCGVTKSKATIFSGLGMIGAGAYVFYRGKQKSNSPQIVFGPTVVGVRQRVSW